MTVGNLRENPLARALYNEILEIEEQHVTHYESILDSTIRTQRVHACTQIGLAPEARAQVDTGNRSSNGVNCSAARLQQTSG